VSQSCGRNFDYQICFSVASLIPGCSRWARNSDKGRCRYSSEYLLVLQVFGLKLDDMVVQLAHEREEKKVR
jgi:hypothetical protein